MKIKEFRELLKGERGRNIIVEFGGAPYRVSGGRLREVGRAVDIILEVDRFDEIDPSQVMEDEIQ